MEFNGQLYLRLGLIGSLELRTARGPPAPRLHRLIDGTTPPDTIDAPQALRLTQEPMANVKRYDALRTEGRHAS